MIPKHSRIVIVGGGIIGSSTAYHLSHYGETDCVILEQGSLTNGSTWHAAGLVGQLRTNANVTQLLKYSVELYDQLERETGHSTGWKMNGGLRLACQPERVRELRRQITMAHSFGLDMHYLSPQEVAKLCPILNIEGIIGAAYLPSDGQANPSDLSLALVKGAKAKGVKFIENCIVNDILTVNGRVAGIQTNHGEIKCEVLVCCAGLWSRAFGGLANVNIPIVPMKHHYIVTGVVDGVTSNMPTIRDPDRLIYFKEDVGGLVFGGYEPNPKRWEIEHPPSDFSFTLLDFDVDHFEPLMEAGLCRIPAMQSADIKFMTCGPESFTPDGNFILGEAPELRNFYIGTGFNAFGIASAGGAGRALAEWICQGSPTFDLSAVDIRRFGRVHRDKNWIEKRTVELCSKHYTIAWPHEEHTSGRPFFRSQLYYELKLANACFGEKMGWERVNWFAPVGNVAKDLYSFGRSNWFTKVGEEHFAVRESVGIIDQSSFAKFSLKGKNSLVVLQHLCANQLDRPIGSVTYTNMLNYKGGIECDITISRTSDDEFFIVAGTGYATHHFAHIQRQISTIADDLEFTDVSDQYSTLSISGPNSRKLLEKLLDRNLPNDNFPFLHCRRLNIFGYEVLAIRVSFAGELGWELHVQVAGAIPIYRALLQIGKEFELTNFGYRALESLRLEKGFLSLGSDIGPDYTPFEAGLQKTVQLNKKSPFIGQKALLDQIEQPLERRLTCFTTENSEIALLGRETIYRNGERAGWTSSAGWGYTVAKNIAYGYIRNSSGVTDEYLYDGVYEIEVEGVKYPATIESECLYDPRGDRMRS